MPINIAWGPLSVTANVPATTPALTLDPADTWVQAGADLAALPAGIAWQVLIQRRLDSTSPWEDNGSAQGNTLGGPDHNRQGQIAETGIIASLPQAWAGRSGRQVRAIATLGVSATVSGHVKTG